MSKRKICVVTTSRAEYGLLYWLMREIDEDPDTQLQVLVSGSHLSAEFGSSYQLIEADGFTIDEKVDALPARDCAADVASALGVTTIGVTEALVRLAPDVMVVLGDRYEILGAVQAAFLLKIPVAHIHGGEVTSGALDDSIRHAITKLAHLHFPVAEPYARRIIQLGEAPEHIYQFGAPGLDHITRTPLWSRERLEENLNIHFAPRNFLVVYHPVTTKADPASGMRELLLALERYPEVHCIFSKSNADEGGRRIGQMIDEFVAAHAHRAWAFPVLGLPRYLSVAKQCDLVLGNSSSGLIEIPAIGVPSVNVGDRESGRLLASSVVNCAEQVDEIVAAIEYALSDQMQQRLSQIDQPYGAGDASVRIKNVLKTVPLSSLIVKQFQDVVIEEEERVL